MADGLPLGTEQKDTVVCLRSPPSPPTLLTQTLESDDYPQVVPCTHAQHEALLTQMWPHEDERRIMEWIVDVADKRTGDRCIDFHIDRAENASHDRLRDMRETKQRMLLRHEAVWRELMRAGDQIAAQRAAGASDVALDAPAAHLRKLRENAVESILEAGAWKNDAE